MAGGSSLWRSLARGALAATVVVALVGIGAGSAGASEVVRTCGAYGNEVFSHTAVFGINTSQACPIASVPDQQGLDLSAPGNSVANDQRGYWEATAPAVLSIRDAAIPSMHIGSVNSGQQYGGGFFWGPGDTSGATYTDVTTNADYGVADVRLSARVRRQPLHPWRHSVYRRGRSDRR